MNYKGKLNLFPLSCGLEPSPWKKSSPCWDCFFPDCYCFFESEVPRVTWRHGLMRRATLRGRRGDSHPCAGLDGLSHHGSTVDIRGDGYRLGQIVKAGSPLYLPPYPDDGPRHVVVSGPTEAAGEECVSRCLQGLAFWSSP